MAFKISEFRAAFPSGVARPNLWKATLTTSSLNTPVPSNFTFRCEKAELPGRTIATVDDIGSGPPLKIPYDVNYNDIEITIICGNDFAERIYFENWIESIVKTKTDDSNSGLLRYYNDYAKGNVLTLEQINDSGESLITYKLNDIYPVSISSMNLSWEEINTYQRFSVTLNYRYYDVDLSGSNIAKK